MRHPDQDCIEAAQACAEACDRCTAAGLREKDVATMAECIRLNLDCTQLCRLAAAALARDSAFAVEICQLCAGICDACGAECGRHRHDHCQACAQACRTCADACRRVVPGSAAPAPHAAAGAH